MTSRTPLPPAAPRPTAPSPTRFPWWQPACGGLERSLVQQVIASNYLNEGEWTDRFEAAVARLLDVRYAVATSSGTAALFVALAALGIGLGDEVLVPDVTFIATANAVSLTGATPVLVDIAPDTLTMCPAAAERSITPATRAICPVHVSGRGADMTALMALAKQHGLVLVEDAAEAFMSRQAGRALGTIGEAGCFSFSPNKIITTGQGGIVVTNDPQTAVRLRELKDQGRPVRGTGGDDVHHSLGYNFKLTNLQAAVGIGQLELLNERLARARRTYEIYRERLADVPGIRVLKFAVEHAETPLWVDAIVQQRDTLDQYLAAQGYGCRRFWHPLHAQAPYRQGDERFPHSTRLARQALWLPTSFQLTDEHVERIASLIAQQVGSVKRLSA